MPRERPRPPLAQRVSTWTVGLGDALRLGEKGCVRIFEFNGDRVVFVVYDELGGPHAGQRVHRRQGQSVIVGMATVSVKRIHKDGKRKIELGVVCPSEIPIELIKA